MQIIGEPYKFEAWQLQKIIDNYGEEKIQIKLFKKKKGGGLDFFKFQTIYVKEDDWNDMKKEIYNTYGK